MKSVELGEKREDLTLILKIDSIGIIFGLMREVYNMEETRKMIPKFLALPLSSCLI